MTLHIYTANRQPATRYRVELDGRGIWIRSPARRQMFARCCKRMRIAVNCVVQVYYDGVYTSCKPGKGCREAAPRSKVHGSRIRKLGKQALDAGNDSLATLCEVALGGDGVLNRISRAHVENLIRYSDAMGARMGKVEL